MYKLMIVEDDRGIRDSVCDLAKKWGFETFACEDFGNVTKCVADLSPHVILLDITLPYFDGYYWCAEIRKISKVPIVFISSVSDNMNIVMAMNLGADDFISKPFDGSVLMAKLKAILRRSYDFPSDRTVIEHRGAFFNTADGSLRFKDGRIELTKNEYRILLCLMENKGSTVSREKLMECLWETDSFVDENTLTVNVARLRKKLDSAGLERFIKTKVGVGYFIEDEK